MRCKYVFMFVVAFLICISFNPVEVKATTMYWNHYFGRDSSCNANWWYEGAKNASEPVISADGSCWTAELEELGWGGIFSAQMYGYTFISSDCDYKLSFDITSSNCNKWIFYDIKLYNSLTYGKWIRLTKGEKTHISVRITNVDGNLFAINFGGEFGDREPTDGSEHYNLIEGGAETIQLHSDGDSTYSTTIICENFSLEKVSKMSTVKNIKRYKKKAVVKLDMTNVSKYKIKYSSTKKYKRSKTKTVVTKKAKYTIKGLKKNKKYYIKVKAYGDNSTYKWSKTYKIKKCK